MSERFFFAPAGTGLPTAGDLVGFTEVTSVSFDGFTALGDAAADVGRALGELAKVFEPVTLMLKLQPLPPGSYRALFGVWGDGKRARKRFMAGYKRNRRAWRLAQRDAQRAAIGMKGATK